MKNRVPVREFLKQEPVNLLNWLKSNKYVLFEDGEVRYMTARTIIFVRYFWEVIKDIKDFKITSKYELKDYLTNGYLSKATHNKIFTEMLKDIIKYHLPPDNEKAAFLDIIYKKMLKAVNDIYKEVVYETLEYATSIDSLDLLDLQMTTVLLEAMEDVKRKQDNFSIQNSYKIIDDLNMRDPEFAMNPVSIAYKAGTINRNQIKQVLGPRGKGTDMYSNIYKSPIEDSFCKGISNPYNMIVESMSAQKALNMSNQAIQTSEYFAREVQLVCMSVENLEFGDCGSKEYIDWYVKPEIVSNGAVVQKCDLNNMEGTWYLDETAGIEKVIKQSSKELIGKNIKIRNPIKCQHKDPKTICSRCFGDLSYGVPGHANLGHITSTSVTRDITQSILSTKHLVASAISAHVTLDDIASKFFTIHKGSGYTLNKNWMNRKKSNIKLLIPYSQFFGIKELETCTSSEDFNKLDPNRISIIDTFIVSVYNDKDTSEEYYPIKVGIGNRHGVFQNNFLKYCITQGFEIDNDDNVVVDMKNWTLSNPFMILPEVEFSFLDLAKEVKSLLKTRKANTSPELLLTSMFDLINSKLNSNIALISIIVYAFCIRDISKKDYRLARGVKNPAVGTFSSIINNRSLGATYAWERIPGNIFSTLYFRGNRESTVMDKFILPNIINK